MTNPFEDEDQPFWVLANDEKQYCIWPTFALVPDGWKVELGEASRAECLDFIEKNWTDMRPASLVAAMHAAGEKTVAASAAPR